MRIMQADFSVSTRERNQMINITDMVRSALEESSISDGDVIIHCPHTTAGVTINENADPDVCHDILLRLSELFPQNNPGFRHCEGNSDSHLKSSFVGCSSQVIIANGLLKLGTWQGIFFCEFDGPRNRKVVLQIRGN